MRATALGVAIAVGVALTSSAAADKGFDPDAIYRVPLDDAPRRGPTAAPVTIVVWSDFACQYCNRVEPTLEHLDRLYPGQLRWVFRHFPLDPDEGTLAAEASLAAAAQGRFWPMKDRLFAVHGQVDRVAVDLFAADLGLDLVRFRADLDAGTYRRRVAADVAAARTLGITGTPTFFINGRPVRGNQPMRVFAAVIDQELARAGKLGATGDVYDKLVAGGRRSADVSAEPRPAPEVDASAVYAVGLGLPGHSTGPDDALVTIVVWSDFECPACGRNVPDLDRIKKAHPRDVRVVYRHLPLQSHPHAQLAAEAAVAAAAQGKFWRFHDRLFADQSRLDRASLEDAARTAGLDLVAFRAALDDRRHREAVATDAAAAVAIGVNSTPTMFVNGTMVVGAVGTDHMNAIVDAHLQAAGALMATGNLPRRDVYGLILVSATVRDRADPSRIPSPGENIVKLELDAGDRESAAIAACRGRDRARATGFAERLQGARRTRVEDACAGLGIDLARTR